MESQEPYPKVSVLFVRGRQLTCIHSLIEQLKASEEINFTTVSTGYECLGEHGVNIGFVLITNCRRKK